MTPLNQTVVPLLTADRSNGGRAREIPPQVVAENKHSRKTWRLGSCEIVRLPRRKCSPLLRRLYGTREIS